MVIKRKNKKAWLRIVEATLSILIILSAALIYYQTKQIRYTDNFNENIPVLVDEAVKNETLRGIILNTDLAAGTSVENAQNEISQFLSDKIIRNDLNYSFIICRANESCPLPLQSNLAGDVYSYERIVSTNLTTDFNYQITPRKVKLYIWKIG